MSQLSQESKTERISAAVTPSEKRLLDLVRTIDGDISTLLRTQTLTQLIERGQLLKEHVEQIRPLSAVA